MPIFNIWSREATERYTTCILSLLVSSVSFSNSRNSSWTPKGGFSISKVRVIFRLGLNSWITPLNPYLFPLASVVSNCQLPCCLFSSFNTFVPIHCSTMSGSTYARKSNSNGKSNSLVISNSCLPSSALILVFSCIAILFFGFVSFHDGFQFIKSVIPQFSEWFDKVCQL